MVRDNRQGGFNKDGQRDNRQGGFNKDGQRDGRQGGFSGRSGQGSGRGQSGKSSFDAPVQTKPSSNRQNKNAHKNDRFDKEIG